MKKVFLIATLLISVWLFSANTTQAQLNTLDSMSFSSEYGYKTLTISGGELPPDKTRRNSNLEITNATTGSIWVSFSKMDGSTDTTHWRKEIKKGKTWAFPSVKQPKVHIKALSGNGKVYVEVIRGGGESPNQPINSINSNFEDSVSTAGDLWQIGTTSDRPVTYYTFSDVGQPQVGLNGSVSNGELNIGLNLDYRDGIHRYFDSTKAQTYLTMNYTEGLVWQWIPAGWGNYYTSQPDAWSRSGNTYNFQIDTQGNAKFRGGIVSILKKRGQPNINASQVNDEFDTTRYNAYFRNGKNYFQNKVGIGTETPYSKLHLIGDAGSNGGSYNANADVIIDDAGTRALLQLINPTSSYITFGDASTYNLGYLGYTNSTGVLSIFGTTAVDINSIREGGTALSSKYFSVTSADTLPKLNGQNTFSQNTKFSGHLAIGTSGINPQPWIAVGVDNSVINRIVLNGVNTTVNKDRTTDAQATDSASYSVWISALGNVTINAKNGTGTTTFNLDSTGRILNSSYIQAGTDFVSVSQKGYVIGFNSSGTQGAYLNSTADGFLRIRNAGVSSDATVQLGRLIATNVTPISTASSTGTQGTIVVGSDGYIYICTATNTWVRVQGVTW